MRDQDEQLEGVSYTVGNLRQQAREMGDELDDQVMYIPLSLIHTDYLMISTIKSKAHIPNCGGELNDYSTLFWRMKVKSCQRDLHPESKSNYCIIALIIVLFILLFMVVMI
jgi:member of the syntaxin family of t-SNAREs